MAIADVGDSMYVEPTRGRCLLRCFHDQATGSILVLFSSINNGGRLAYRSEWYDSISIRIVVVAANKSTITGRTQDEMLAT